MSVEIVQGTSHKPAASKALVEQISTLTELTGQFFIGYPVIATPQGPHWIDALLVSKNYGIVIFHLIEGTKTGNYGFEQDDSANKLEARLRTHSELIDRRTLLIPIRTISFAPGVGNTSLHADDDYPIANSESLTEELLNFRWKSETDNQAEVYARTLSALESISGIRKSDTPRRIRSSNSRGNKLKVLENSIATLDNDQRKAVIETVDGVQRIRGLAGSGKTVVLSLKAAYLHAKYPDWRIAVTFNTRSLKGHFRRLINNFSISQTGQEPDWGNLRILNSWGAPGDEDREGVYYEFCHTHNVKYYDFGTAKENFGRGREFSEVCKFALKQAESFKKLYDVILVDEAQDLSPYFLRLCYEILGAEKRLVYAYDELQNLSGESLPSPEVVFGKDTKGIPRVRLGGQRSEEPQNDIILPICYRNSRPVLVAAHALGFGIYRKPYRDEEMGLIQMFDHAKLWEDIGYHLKDGELNEGSSVVLSRSESTSPKFLENHSNIEDLIQFVSFDSEEDQASWLTEEIRKNLQSDELRHDDIMVINTDPITTRDKVGPLRARLLELDIDCHLAGVDNNPDVFFLGDAASVTFTGVYRAKGNEAGVVYIINAQDCHAAVWNLASLRNRLFTAITRSKAWIRVLGVGPGMDELKEEYLKLKANNFELHFVYPTRKQREKLRIVHRDMTSEERKRLENRQKGIENLINDLEMGKMHIEDLEQSQIAKLLEIFGRKAKDNAKSKSDS